MGTLQGQVAVVTGGGSGIGRAIALRLSEQGAYVWIADIQEENALQVAAQIKERGDQAAAYRLDVSDSAQVARFFATVEEVCGKVDILINNAGIAGNPALLTQLTDGEWQRMLDIHVNGSFYCLREAAKSMVKNRYGRVVNMSSLAAETSLAGFAHYAAAKYAIVGLTETAAKELAGYQITVNAIKPGVIRSALSKGFLEMAEERLVHATPCKRIGEPEDIAQVAAMLVQPGTSFVSGITVVVDGGFTLYSEMDRVMLEALGQQA